MKQLSQNLLKIRNDKTGEYEIMPAVGGDKASSILYKNTNNVLDGENVQDVLDDVSSKIGRTLTKAEYDALSQYEKENGTYYIKDVNVMLGASGVEYDNRHSKLDAETVQEAIDELEKKNNSVAESINNIINDNGVSTDNTWSSSKIQKTIEGIVVSGGGEGTGSALTTAYDNSTSGLNAGSVQGAIDELDTRVDEMNDKFLPLSGGTLSGHLYTTGAFYKSTDNSNLPVCGGSTWANGSSMTLYGKDSSSNPGVFALRASDGTNTCQLTGKPDGTLTWKGVPLYGEHNKDTMPFLPLTGGILSNTLKIAPAAGTMPQYFGVNATAGRTFSIEMTDAGILNLVNQADGNNNVYLRLNNETTNLFNMLRIRTEISNVETNYKVYGEHNITAGTTDITAGSSALTSACYYDVYV